MAHSPRSAAARGVGDSRGWRTVTAATGGMVTVRSRRPAGASARELRARVSSR